MHSNYSSHYSLVCLFCFFTTLCFSQKSYEYPVAKKGDYIDVYFGDSIADPYQWMEDPSNADLAVWLEEQKKITKKQENKQTKMWTLRAQLGEMYNGKRERTTKEYVKEYISKEKYEFILRSTNFNNSRDLKYRRRTNEAYKGNFKVLVRAKDFLSQKDEKIDINIVSTNNEENLIAISVSRNGSDWNEVYIYDLITGDKLSDKLEHRRLGGSFSWHGRNAYYTRCDAPIKGRELLDPAIGEKVFYHNQGEPQDQDSLIYSSVDETSRGYISFFKNKDRLFFKHYLESGEGLVRSISYSDIDPKKFALINFFNYPNDDKIDLHISKVIGDSVLMNTNWYAPNGRILLANVHEFNKAEEFITEYDVTLVGLSLLGADKLVSMYRGENYDVALIFDRSGKMLKKMAFPEGKKVFGFSQKNYKAKYLEFAVASFYHPNMEYQMSLDDFSIEQINKLSVPYAANSMETRYVKYKSKDGTEIPMYITCKKNTKLDGKNPTLIHGYGGYGHTIDPSFDESMALFIEHGGVYVIPNIRGGGANGSDWAREGRRLQKQTCIDDFIYAAEYLIENKYTNPSKLCISGGSHGGLLVGAAITQRPDLYKAAIIAAGALDMLRFEKFTTGKANVNIEEFGTVSNEKDYKNLLSYSPLHNVKHGQLYPNTLLITGDKDDRVVPHNTYKFLSTLQDKGDAKGLYYIYVNENSSHSGAITGEDWAKGKVFKLYFLMDQLGVRFY